MAYTEAQKKAIIKYLQEKTDDIRLRLPKGTKERWKTAAESAGQSMTAYVHDAVDARMAYDEAKEHEIDAHVIKNLMDWLRENGHSEEEILECLSSLQKK